MCNKATEEWGETLEELSKEGLSIWNNADTSLFFSHHLS